VGEDPEVIGYQNLYRCLDQLLAHKEGLFGCLQRRWQDLFEADFELLLYGLTSTYFECEPPGSGKRRHGYSRDHRPDCVQAVIGLVVTPQGLPLAYEVLAGNTRDCTTLRQFLDKDREAIRQGASHLGDGPWDSDRRTAGRDETIRPADWLPGGDSQGPPQPDGAAVCRAAVAAGAGATGSQAGCWGRRALRAGSQRP
jgi:hypothetical protein